MKKNDGRNTPLEHEKTSVNKLEYHIKGEFCKIEFDLSDLTEPERLSVAIDLLKYRCGSKYTNLKSKLISYKKKQ